MPPSSDVDRFFNFLIYFFTRQVQSRVGVGNFFHGLVKCDTCFLEVNPFPKKINDGGKFLIEQH